MFKKIEVWILYVTILLSVIFAIFFGFLVRQELVGSAKLGMMSQIALRLAESPSTLKKIFSPPDTQVVDRFPEQSRFTGEPNLEESFLLLSRSIGKNSIVELIDLRTFETIHVWDPDLNQIHSDVAESGEMSHLSRDFNDTRAELRHPYFFEDGSLVYTTKTLQKIDACSNLIWQLSNDVYHHSVEIDHNGNLWVPSHMYPSSFGADIVGSSHTEFLDDAITQISPDGEVLFQRSIAEIFKDNQLDYLLFSVGDKGFTTDPIHLNDIQPVFTDGVFWKKGDLFLSLRHQSMILLYRPVTNEIIWKSTGPFYHQHDIDVLDRSKISIFNNNSKDFKTGNVVDGYNEVIIYDFSNQEFISYMAESLERYDVKTITQGRSEILPTGQLFVEEQNYGRILFFNPDNTLRWSFVNRNLEGNVNVVSWSRVLYTLDDVKRVRNFFEKETDCD